MRLREIKGVIRKRNKIKGLENLWTNRTFLDLTTH